MKDIPARYIRNLAKILPDIGRVKDLDKLVLDLINTEKKENRQLIFYLRLYTYLIISFELFRIKDTKRCTYNLVLARNLTNHYGSKNEKVYADRIKSHINDALSQVKKNPDFHRVRASIETGQSICVLRMLRI